MRSVINTSQMEKITLIIVFFFIKFALFSQTDSVYSNPEERAVFSGGEIEFMKFISANIKYPEQAKQIKISTISNIKFIVEKDGSLDNISVATPNKNCPDCDKEAIRVFKLMPKWNPAKHRGEIRRSTIFFPLKFKWTEK